MHCSIVNGVLMFWFVAVGFGIRSCCYYDILGGPVLIRDLNKSYFYFVFFQINRWFNIISPSLSLSFSLSITHTRTQTFLFQSL